MFHEYAIDPSLLSDVFNCERIFASFKPEQGRILSDVPRKWHEAAFQAINSIPHDRCQPVMKKTLKNALRKLLQEDLCVNRNCRSWDKQAETWIQYAADRNAEYPFAAILAGEASEEPVKAYALSQLLISHPECWGEATQIPVPREASEIVDALMPLFRMSRRIELVDMHLYPGEAASRRVLVQLLQRVEEFNFGRGVKRIVVHSSDHRKDMQSALTTHLMRHLPTDFVLEYKLWPISVEHDRFALTDVGGIDLGHGFDEAKPGRATEVRMSLLTHEERKRLIAKFSGTPTYVASISTQVEP